MANSCCPHCQTPIRGLQVFKARASEWDGPKGGYRCPGCHTLLVVLPNRWQITGLLVAIAAITLRWIVDRVEFPSLWMGLAVCTMAGFGIALVGILYFPRYGVIKGGASS